MWQYLGMEMLEEAAALLEARSPLTAYLTIPQVATHLQVHERTVWRWVNEKKLPCVRLSKRVTRISREDLLDFEQSARRA